MTTEARTEEAAPTLLDVCATFLASEQCAPIRAALAAAPDLPQSPEAWFDLCANYGSDAIERLSRLKARASGAPVEYFAAFSALPVTLERMKSMRLPNSVRREFDAMCREWAVMEPRWAEHFNLSSPRFNDIMALSALHRFPVGDLAFGFAKRPPFNFVFRCHPLDLAGLVAQLVGPMRGASPSLSVHFNYARRNQLIMSQKEFERALWRMAKVLEENPNVTGIFSNAWFHSAAVRDAFPRLTWMRDVFVEGGAYLIDLEPGHEEDIVFNSAKRGELYQAGAFTPRHTLVLWPRDSVLSWAAARPDLADPDEAIIIAPKGVLRKSVVSPAVRPNAKTNSSLRLWDGVAWRNRFGSKYWAALLGGPSAAAALACGFVFGWFWAAPAFIVTLAVVLVLQYYLSQ